METSGLCFLLTKHSQIHSHIVQWVHKIHTLSNTQTHTHVRKNNYIPIPLDTFPCLSFIFSEHLHIPLGVWVEQLFPFPFSCLPSNKCQLITPWQFGWAPSFPVLCCACSLWGCMKSQASKTPVRNSQRWGLIYKATTPHPSPFRHWFPKRELINTYHKWYNQPAPTWGGYNVSFTSKDEAIAAG